MLKLTCLHTNMGPLFGRNDFAKLDLDSFFAYCSAMLTLLAIILSVLCSQIAVGVMVLDNTLPLQVIGFIFHYQFSSIWLHPSHQVVNMQHKV